mmetsp:Transcript_57053/g.170076  ORF Transcript_57053/g.170076 Transcript_57053/m.170076 type:complete len:85 (-) Transcript_57053:210-464(-)
MKLFAWLCLRPQCHRDLYCPENASLKFPTHLAAAVLQPFARLRHQRQHRRFIKEFNQTPSSRINILPPNVLPPSIAYISDGDYL